MHILFAGGGTAGHINPALAVATYIKKKHPTAKISYIGKKGGMEERLVADAGFEFYPIEVAGFQRRLSAENIKRNIDAFKKVFSASKRSSELLKSLKPDIVMGTGGYVSGPVLREATRLKIKTAIHEQNAFPGITTKMLTKHVDVVMLAMKEAEPKLKFKNSPVITGNPVRGEMLRYKKAEARTMLGIPQDALVLLSMGGSLGAGKINEAMADIIKNNWKDGRIFFIHGAGRANYEGFVNKLNQFGVDLNADNLIIKDYLDSTVCMPAADLIISRAGAITLTEIGVCGKPAIFVPSPNVAENHQYFNALSLKNIGAAELIEEKNISELENAVYNIIFNEQKLNSMGAKIRSATIADATQKIYNELMKLYTKTV